MLHYKKRWYSTILCSSKIKFSLFNAGIPHPKIFKQLSFPKNDDLEEHWIVKDETYLQSMNVKSFNYSFLGRK